MTCMHVILSVEMLVTTQIPQILMCKMIIFCMLLTSFLGLKHRMKEKQIKSSLHFLIISGVTISSTGSGDGSHTGADSDRDESSDERKNEKEDQSTIVYILIASLVGIILLIIILISMHRYRSMLN